jgi:hypothetical protein
MILDNKYTVYSCSIFRKQSTQQLEFLPVQLVSAMCQMGYLLN